MKTMKIIDLLNNIASGITYPKIKYKDKIYEFKDTVYGTGYVNENKGINNWFSEDALSDNIKDLNQEIEIIEDKTSVDIKELEIEQIMGENLEDTEFDKYYINGFYIGKQGDELTYAIKDIAYKVNQIIRTIKQIGNEGK